MANGLYSTPIPTGISTILQQQATMVGGTTMPQVSTPMPTMTTPQVSTVMPTMPTMTTMTTPQVSTVMPAVVSNNNIQSQPITPGVLDYIPYNTMFAFSIEELKTKTGIDGLYYPNNYTMPRDLDKINTPNVSGMALDIGIVSYEYINTAPSVDTIQEYVKLSQSFYSKPETINYNEVQPMPVIGMQKVSMVNQLYSTDFTTINNFSQNIQTGKVSIPVNTFYSS